MNGFRPGDRVLFRDGDRFGVACVDLVKDRHLTAFPFDTNRRRWSSKNRRIGLSFVVGKVSLTDSPDLVAAKLNRLAIEREAMRQQANRWLEDQVRELAVL